MVVDGSLIINEAKTNTNNYVESDVAKAAELRHVRYKKRKKQRNGERQGKRREKVGCREGRGRERRVRRDRQ